MIVGVSDLPYSCKAQNVAVRPHLRYRSTQFPGTQRCSQKKNPHNHSLSSFVVSFSVYLPTNERSGVAVSPLSLIASSVHLPPQRLFRTLPRPLLHFRPRRTRIIRTHLQDCASNQLSLADEEGRFDCARRRDQMRVQNRHR